MREGIGTKQVETGWVVYRGNWRSKTRTRVKTKRRRVEEQFNVEPEDGKHMKK